MLVGLVVDDREVGSLDVWRTAERYLLPIEALGPALGVAVEPDGDGYLFRTPLGDVALVGTAVRQVDGISYAGSDDLESLLSMGVVFDEGRFALRLDPPWSASEAGGPVAAPSRAPDITAPQSSLTGLSGRLSHTRLGDSTTLAGSVRMEGRLADGAWALRVEDSNRRTFQVREYEWMTRRDRMSYLVGRRQTQLHPSLSGFDVAGLQLAYSNRDDHDPASLESYGLSSAGARPVETFAGQASPGSFAQLRIENRVVDRVQVGYDGRYEFRDVQLPSRQLSEVEVLIFDRHDRNVPIESRRFRLATSNLLLPANAMFQTGGVGVTGIFTEGFVGGPADSPSSAGGFYQWRQGLSSRVTGETTMQYAGDKFQTYTGVVTRLSDTWVMGLGVSYTPGAAGHSFDLEGFARGWRFYARSQSIPAEFQLIGKTFDRVDHVFEAYVQPLPGLSVGATARSRDDGTRESRYVLPSVSWRPIAGLYFDVRPDIYGEYLGNALWEMRRDTRLRLYVAETVETEVSHDPVERYRIALNGSFGGGLPDRYALTATRRPASVRGWSLQAGLVHSDNELGYLVNVNTPVLPGVQMQAEYQSIPYRSFSGQSDLSRLLISVSADLSHVGGSLLPARGHHRQRSRGSIGGRIHVESRYRELVAGRPDLGDLSGIAVRVDGRTLARTDAGGRYFIQGLEPGYHDVELDPEHLPIELTPVRSRFLVEVEAAAATRVDFVVRPEFGIAGRVRDAAGNPVSGVTIEMLGPAEETLQVAVSDRFGLYRIDGLAPGGYMLRVSETTSDGHTGVRAWRVVHIDNDFLFDQDLDLAEEESDAP